MKIVDRVRMSISHRADQVILRSELSEFGGHSQLSVALKRLIDDGVLMRMGRPGVFAKAKKTSKGTCDLLCDDVEAVFQEYFRKIHLKARLLRTEKNKYQCKVIVDSPQSKKLEEHFGRYVVVYFHEQAGQQPRSLEVPQDIEKLPKKNVGKFIVALANAYQIGAERSKIDVWAEAVSRAAGDEVQLDNIEQLLTRLYKSKVINGRQMGRLMANYSLETKNKKIREHKSVSSPVDIHGMSAC